MDFNTTHTNVGYNISSEFDVQDLGLKIKVTVAILEKKQNLCHRSNAYIYLWILI